MAAAPEIIQPARHILAMPEDCECGMCTPSWARRRGKARRYSELVTLADALGPEDSAAPPAMIAQHAACLPALTAAAVRAFTAEPGHEPGAPGRSYAPLGPSRRRVTSRVVPAPGGLSIRRWPPSASARSLSPTRPEPRLKSAPPRPSSRTRTCRMRSLSVIWTSALLARA